MPIPLHQPELSTADRVAFSLPRFKAPGCPIHFFYLSPEDVDLLQLHEKWYFHKGDGGKLRVGYKPCHEGRTGPCVYLSKLVCERIDPDAANLRYIDGDTLNMVRSNLKLLYTPEPRSLNSRPTFGQRAHPTLNHLGVNHG